MKNQQLKIIAFFASMLVVTIIIVSGCGVDNPTNTAIKDNLSPTLIINNSYAVPPLDIDSQSQALADTFSWRTFIAMNWPANVNTCSPDTSPGNSILTGKGPVVWETFLSADQIFVKSPQVPAKWCSGSFEHVPQKVMELAKATGVYRFLHRTSKSPSALEQASGQPLVDQNGRFVRYEVRVNKDEYNYIMAKSLWSRAGQNRFPKDSVISFPAGPIPQYGSIGAMEFKAAWKIMGPGDDPSRFYTIKAIVYNDDNLDPSPGQNPVTLGLVGLHIAHKTASQRFWVWSTFEQVDNLTTSFHNAKCDSCPTNQPPSGGPNYKELDNNGNPIHKPTQVTRVNRVDSSSVGDLFVDGINKHFRSLLKASVWGNYQLVSTQWLLNEDIFPQFLANTVQETYLQGPNPPSYGDVTIFEGEQYFQSNKYHPFANGISSSCMGCHYTATGAVPKLKTDFSFLLGEAK
jgi:hypothetical protein